MPLSLHSRPLSHSVSSSSPSSFPIPLEIRFHASLETLFYAWLCYCLETRRSNLDQKRRGVRRRSEIGIGGLNSFRKLSLSSVSWYKRCVSFHHFYLQVSDSNKFTGFPSSSLSFSLLWQMAKFLLPYYFPPPFFNIRNLHSLSSRIIHLSILIFSLPIQFFYFFFFFSSSGERLILNHHSSFWTLAFHSFHSFRNFILFYSIFFPSSSSSHPSQERFFHSSLSLPLGQKRWAPFLLLLHPLILVKLLCILSWRRCKKRRGKMNLR